MYVYLVTDGLAYKIGVTNNLEQRVSQLQTGNPNKIRLIASSAKLDNNTARYIETSIHQGLTRLGVRQLNEWFKLDNNYLRMVMSEMRCF